MYVWSCMKYRSRSIESSLRELCDGDQCCSSRAAFYALLRMVAAQAGATVSAHELANTIGVSLTNEHSAFELKMNPAKFSRKKVRSFLEAYPEIPLSVVTARSDKELDLLLEIEDGFYAMKVQQGRSVHSSDARHLNGLSGLLDKPLIHSFLVSHDPTVKQFRTRMTAIPAAALLS